MAKKLEKSSKPIMKESARRAPGIAAGIDDNPRAPAFAKDPVPVLKASQGIDRPLKGDALRAVRAFQQGGGMKSVEKMLGSMSSRARADIGGQIMGQDVRRWGEMSVQDQAKAVARLAEADSMAKTPDVKPKAARKPRKAAKASTKAAKAKPPASGGMKSVETMLRSMSSAARSGDIGRGAAAVTRSKAASIKVIDAADAVIVDKKGNVALIERGRNGGPGSGKLALPGGIVDPGETRARAAIREAFEETGAKLKKGKAVAKPILTGDVRTYDPKYDPTGDLAKKHRLKPGDKFRMRTQAFRFDVDDIGKLGLKAGDDATAVAVRAGSSIKPDDLGIKHHHGLLSDALKAQAKATSASAGSIAALSKSDLVSMAREMGLKPKASASKRDVLASINRVAYARADSIEKVGLAYRAGVTRQQLSAEISEARAQAASRLQELAKKVKSSGLIGFQNESTQEAAQKGKAKAAKQKTVAQLRRDLAATNGGKPSDYNFLKTRKDVVEYGQGRAWEKSYQDHLGRTIDKVNGLKEMGSAAKPRKAAAAPKADVNAVADTKPTVKAMRAEAKSAGITNASKMNKSQLMKLRDAGKFSITALIAAPAVAAAIAYDSTRSTALASGKGGTAATGDALKAAAGAGAGAAAVTGTIVGGMKLAAKAAPAVAKVASRAFLPLTAAMAAYEVGRGAVAGYAKGGVSGAIQGGAMGGADFLTFGGASYVANRKVRGEGQREAVNMASRGLKKAERKPRDPKSDVFVEGFTRRQNGKMVTVQTRKMTAKEMARRFGA